LTTTAAFANPITFSNSEIPQQAMAHDTEQDDRDFDDDDDEPLDAEEELMEEEEVALVDPNDVQPNAVS